MTQSKIGPNNHNVPLRDKTKSKLFTRPHQSQYKVKLTRHERSFALSHDNAEKREEGRLKLHISKTQREIDAIERRLRSWDEKEEQLKIEQAITPMNVVDKKKKKGRLGPESWKLRGAARPASQVYSFDTRYVCPYESDHIEALEKAKRVQDILDLYRGKFGRWDKEEQLPSPLLSKTCREYIALRMRFGLLNLEAKRFKLAKETFLEIIELEGDDNPHPISTARCRLMRMYLEANRLDSARLLWERLTEDISVWIRYSAALIEFVSWKVLHEKASTEKTAEALLAQAVRANLFCAFYIAHHETFRSVMEFAEDIEDAEDGTVEQALEYCHSEQVHAWIETQGAIDWIRSFLLRAIQSSSSSSSSSDDRLLSHKDVDWEAKLIDLEVNTAEDEQDDKLMFTGMFRTAMDMLTDDGAFL